MLPLIVAHIKSLKDRPQAHFKGYSGVYDLRPLHLTVPSILRPGLIDTTLNIFSINIPPF